MDRTNDVFQFFVGGGCCFVSGERAEQQFHFVFITFDIVDPVNVIIKNSLQILGGQISARDTCPPSFLTPLCLFCSISDNKYLRVWSILNKTH